jgi:glycosyltransferase involved in cell wall biosynthesis
MSNGEQFHIAVILPEGYRGGTLRGAMNIVRMLAIGAQDVGDKLKLSFGHLDLPDVYSDSDFDEICQLNVKVRPFLRQTMNGSELKSLYDSWINIPIEEQAAEYVIFNDGVSNFEDADFWLIISDRLPACIPPHRRYAVVIYDYIQRYVPEIFGRNKNSESNWLLFEKYAEAARKATFVLCTTEQTRRDCINYSGVSPDKVVLFPMEFDPVDFRPVAGSVCDDTDRPYIIWTTNSTQHKNHLNVIAGLEQYFCEHPDSLLYIRMTGVYTHLFSIEGKADRHFKDEYVVQVRQLIAKSQHLRDRLKILGNLTDEEYLQELAGADWLLHGALYDNGTFALVEAAWLGIPAISSDYPAIREQCKTFGLNLQFFDPNQPASLANVLASCYGKRVQAVQSLPTREQLSNCSYLKIAPTYWNKFKESLISQGVFL